MPTAAKYTEDEIMAAIAAYQEGGISAVVGPPPIRVYEWMAARNIPKRGYVKPPQHTDAQIDEAIRTYYAAGPSAVTGVSLGTLYKWLNERELPLRGPHAPTKWDDHITDILRRFDAGENRDQIAADLGISRARLYAIVKSARNATPDTAVPASL